MQKRRKWLRTVIAMSSLLLLTSCGTEPKQLERLGLITAIGFDLKKENEIKGTVSVTKFDPMAKVMTNLITADANTLQTLRAEENLAIDQRLEMGQLRCVIYSEELAEKGIIQLVNALNRDPTVGNMVYLTIAEKDAFSIISMDEKKIKVNIGTYLYNLIRQNVERELLISPTLHEFNHKFFDYGQDPVLPILKVKKDKAAIAGVALFNDDKMVARLSNDKLFYLKLLTDEYRTGSKELEFNRDEFSKIINVQGGQSYGQIYNKLFISIDNLRSNTKIDLVDKKNLAFKVKIKMDSRLLETTNYLDLGKPANMKFIEKKINKEMEYQVRKLLLFFKEKQVDPIGFGNEYMAHVRGKPITQKEWKELYKNAKFDVQVKNTLTKTGTMD
ncbi:Ger(x)C family spore germination protein [Neobacillus sp. DY30]|uniref:Ger(x)C family spore germination protein n=1 Tax=Neobacillus sp. DY30 TaxID=3047871 RepID=UPI0024C05248|nr:Ger(x)C family spore germination protein [Neobacillus sp. DY30]WHX98969.1 Ger(x)C family spore germination protein [Neobacillus sp. DY30]